LKEDEERTDILKLLGLNVIRFKNDEVEKSLGNVLERMKKIIE
jgi:very-short-patch-repair endonuclease